jgi:hypothetical protein
VTPTDPQGAGETRVETTEVWQNVYRPEANLFPMVFATKEDADKYADILGYDGALHRRIAVERIETTTTITRIAVCGDGSE